MATKRDKILAFVIIFVFLIIVVFILNILGINGTDNLGVPYSVKNFNNKGTSLLVDSLKEYGFGMAATANPAHETDLDTPQIILSQQGSYATNQDYYDGLFEWVSKGGRAVLLVRQANSLWVREDNLFDRRIWDTRETIFINDRPMDIRYSYYRLGEGYLLLGELDSVTNIAIKYDASAAYPIVNVCRQWAPSVIYYNIKDFQSEPVQIESSLWRDASAEAKVIVLQMAIAGALVVYMLGKRFGKPIPYYEEAEREENEYLKAVASLYYQAGFSNIILENYYGDLMQELSAYSRGELQEVRQDPVKYWQLAGLPDADKAADIIKGIQFNQKMPVKKRRDRQRFIRKIKQIQSLKKIIEKSRYYGN